MNQGRPLMPFPNLVYHHQGLISVDGPLLLAVVEPILRSDATDPPRGALPMGRHLNHAVVDSLAQRTRLDLQVHGLPLGATAAARATGSILPKRNPRPWPFRGTRERGTSQTR